MAALEQIFDLVETPSLRRFAQFVMARCEPGMLPDYKKLDLMLVPGLAKCIWVYDLRTAEGRRRLLVNYSGTENDAFWGRNIQGLYNIDLYVGNPVLEALGAYRLSCIEHKRIGYSRRCLEYTKLDGTTGMKCIESLFFPCSSNGVDVDWAIGCAHFQYGGAVPENIFLEI